LRSVKTVGLREDAGGIIRQRVLHMAMGHIDRTLMRYLNKLLRSPRIKNQAIKNTGWGAERHTERRGTLRDQCGRILLRGDHRARKGGAQDLSRIWRHRYARSGRITYSTTKKNGGTHLRSGGISIRVRQELSASKCFKRGPGRGGNVWG